MNIEMTEFVPLLPEIWVLSMACVVLVLDLFLHDRNRVISYGLSQLTLVGALGLTLALSSSETQVVLSGGFVADPMAALLKAFIYVVTFGAFVYARDYLRERALFKGEYYVLGLFGMLGMMVMVSAHSLLTVYLGLELLSLSLYALVAFSRDDARATEAAMKYFVLGALASGMLLYGMSIVYGLTGSLDIATIAGVLVEHGMQDVPLIFALSFIILGIAFKLGAVPFHMWLPDVYQGAPTAVTIYLSSGPKIAAFAMAMRLLAEALGELQADWSGMLIILAVLSLGLGNVVAIAQTNLKRMLAYSAISHVGFLLLGLLAGTEEGYAAAIFYTLTYALMSLGAFGMIVLLSRAGFEAEELDDFRGLNERNPWFAGMMLLLMFSLAGVPPTVGFYAKLVVLQAAIDVELLWLALVAVFFSIVGLFYYLRVVKLMYFDPPVETAPLTPAADLQVTLSINALAMLGLGIFPGGLMALCAAAVV